jgi:hypothetical protein
MVYRFDLPMTNFALTLDARHRRTESEAPRFYELSVDSQGVERPGPCRANSSRTFCAARSTSSWSNNTARTLIRSACGRSLAGRLQFFGTSPGVTRSRSEGSSDRHPQRGMFTLYWHARQVQHQISFHRLASWRLRRAADPSAW